MPDTYCIFRIYSSANGKATIDWETNDDDDDGYPDGEVTRETFHFPSLKKALAFAGKSHTGLYGQPVDVYLDGKKI
jgi:hypothetical protein